MKTAPPINPNKFDLSKVAKDLPQREFTPLKVGQQWRDIQARIDEYKIIPSHSE